MKTKDREDKNNWQPLRELALTTPYTMGYLSLMARRKQLKVKKIGRIWHSTMDNIKEFEEQMKERKELRKKQLQESYREKVKREVLKEIEEESGEDTAPGSRLEALGDTVPETSSRHQPSPPKADPPMEEARSLKRSVVAEDSIFDEIQKELEEVLQEIRDREKKLRQDYLAYRGIHGDDGVEVYGNAALAREKQETEELSEKLIMDLGRLLNTANKIHEEEESALPEDDDKGFLIPVRNKSVHHGNIRTMGMDFGRQGKRPEITKLSDPPTAARATFGRASKAHYNKHKDNFISVPYSAFPFEHYPRRRENKAESSQNKLLIFIAGLLVFIASILIVLVIFG